MFCFFRYQQMQVVLGKLYWRNTKASVSSGKENESKRVERKRAESEREEIKRAREQERREQ